MKIASIEQADNFTSSVQNSFLKRIKNRRERRRASMNPECAPGYGRYQGYSS